MSLERWFPYKELDERDTRSITELLGGPPLSKVEDLIGFFQNLAVPMLKNEFVKQLLEGASQTCAETFDIDQEQGARVFKRGALLYTGVLAELSPLVEVPCETRVLSEIADSEGLQFTWRALERLEAETPSFCSFIGDLAPALGVTQPAERHLAKAGAGLIHIITTESLRCEDDLMLAEAHPELADLDGIFQAIEDQQ